MQHWHHCILAETGRICFGQLACRMTKLEIVNEGKLGYDFASSENEWSKRQRHGNIFASISGNSKLQSDLLSS
jgi:hypothetical protein